MNGNTPEKEIWFAINVGGKIFHTTKTTLTSDFPDDLKLKVKTKPAAAITFGDVHVSKLGQLAVTSYHCPSQEYVMTMKFDRDPTHFQHVLNHLRGTPTVPSTPQELWAFLQEMIFYDVPLSILADDAIQCVEGKQLFPFCGEAYEKFCKTVNESPEHIDAVSITTRFAFKEYDEVKEDFDDFEHFVKSVLYEKRSILFCETVAKVMARERETVHDNYDESTNNNDDDEPIQKWNVLDPPRMDELERACHDVKMHREMKENVGHLEQRVY